MSDKIRKTTLFQSKTYFQNQAKKNNNKNRILPKAYYEIAKKIRNTINSQINQIELEFNKYCKLNKYTNRTLIRNMLDTFDEETGGMGWTRSFMKQ